MEKEHIVIAVVLISLFSIAVGVAVFSYDKEIPLMTFLEDKFSIDSYSQSAKLDLSKEQKKNKTYLKSLKDQKYYIESLVEDANNISNDGVGPSVIGILWDRSWEIVNQSGPEEDLDVNFYHINRTTSALCISAKDLGSYEGKLNSKDISKIPLNKKEKKGDFSFEKGDMDLFNKTDSESDCVLIHYDNWAAGMSFDIGWNTIVVNSTDQGSSFGLESWADQVTMTRSNGKWNVFYIDSQGDIASQLSDVDNLTSWTAGDIIGDKALALDYEDFDQVIDRRQNNSFIHFVYTDSSNQDMFYRRCEAVKGNLTCGTEFEVFNESIPGVETGDDFANPRITLDSNNCVLIAAEFEDDSESTSVEHKLVFTKEAEICGDGIFGTQNHATGFPNLSVGTINPADGNRFPVGIRSYGDLDAQLFWVMDETLEELHTVFFNGTSNNFGTEFILNGDIDYLITERLSLASVISGEKTISFSGKTGSINKVSAFITDNKSVTNISSEVLTPLNVTSDSFTTAAITAAVDTLSANNDIWLFAVDSTDSNDIYYTTSNDSGTTWTDKVLWQDNPDGTDEIKFLTSEFDPNTGDIMVRWLANSVSPFSITIDTINTGSASPLLDFVDPTPADASTQSENSTLINLTIVEPLLDTFTFGWNGTNTTLYDRSLLLLLNLNNFSSLGESNTNVEDASQYRLNGTPSSTGAAPTLAGRYDGAYQFDDASSIIMNGQETLKPVKNITISVWMFEVIEQNQGPLITYDGGSFETYAIRWDSSGSSGGHGAFCQVATTGGGEDSAQTPIPNPPFSVWRNIVLRYNGTHVICFVDGEPGTGVAAASDTLSYPGGGTADTRIGADGTSSFYNGTIDEVMMWNRSLSDAEIRENYRSSLSRVDVDTFKFLYNRTELANSTYNFQGFANDSVGNFNQTANRSFTIGPPPTDVGPTFSDITVNTTDAGEEANFSVLWDDDVALNPKGQYIFSTNITGTFVNDSAVNFTTTPNFANVQKTLNSTVGLAIGYIWYATDDAGNENNTGIQVLITTSGDITPPIFTFIPADQTVDYLDNFSFNFTATDASGIDTFFLNWTIYFQINATGTLNNSETVPVGLFIINVSVNDTLGNVNSTLWNLTVAAINPDAVVTGTSPIIFPTAGDVDITESNPGDGDVTYNLIRDGVIVSRPDTSTLGAGTFEYSSNTSGGANYTSNTSLSNFTLTINQNAESCNVFFNESSPITYPQLFTVSTNCTTAFTLFRNGTSISNTSIQELGAGAYNFTVTRTDDQNYSNIYDEVQFVVTQGDPSLALVLTPSDTILYQTESTATGSSCPSQLSCVLHRDSIVVSNPEVQTLGVALYNYTFNTTGNINFTSDSIGETLRVNTIAPNGSLVNKTLRDLVYPQPFNVTFSENNTVNGDVTYNIFRNSTDVTSEDNVEIILAAGVYNYTLNNTGGTNFTSMFSLDTFLVVVSKNGSSCDMLFNDSSPTPETVPFTAFTNCDSDFVLTRNGTVIANNSVQSLAAGAYNFSVQRNDTGNYTNFFDEVIYIVTAVDTEAPVFTFIPDDLTIDFLDNFSVNFTATDDVGVDTFVINWTIYFQINATGTLNNSQVVPAGFFIINVTVNDTSGNINSTLWNLTVDQINPDAVVAGTSPITFPTAGDVELTDTNPGDDDVTYNLLRDGLIVSNPDTSTLAAATYEYTSNASGGGNYTANSSLSNFTLTVNQNADSCGVLFNETSPITYPQVFNVSTNCTTAFTLFRNGTAITNNTIQVLGAGAYNFTVTRTDDQNYSNIYDEQQFVISQADPALALAITPSNSETYLTETTATGSSCPSQLTCNLFRDNVSVSNPEVATLGVAAYNYTFNTTGNQNFTSDSVSDILTINQATPAATLVNNTLRTLTYPDPFNTTFEESNTGDGDVTYSIFRNSTDVTSEDNVAVVLAVSTYNYTLNTTGGVNYTSVFSLDTFNVVINANPESCNVFFNESSPITYPQLFTVSTNCTTAFTLFRNGTSISNNSIQELAAGAYNFTVTRDDDQNYSNIFDEVEFVVSQADPSLAIAITPSTSETYLTETTATGSSCPSQLTCNLFRDNESVSNPDVQTLGVATYNYTFNTTGNINFTSDSVSDILTITQATPAATLVNNTPKELTYPSPFNTTFAESNTGDADVSYDIFRNSTDVTSEDNVAIVLAAGVYNYTLNTTGGTNYSAVVSLDTFLVVMSKNASSCDVLFNETSPLNFSNVFTAFTNCDSDFVLTRNGTVITNNSVQALAVGAYNFSVQRNDTGNYTNFFDEEQFVILAADITGPNITIHSPLNITYNFSSIDLNVTADEFVDTWWWTNDSGVTNNTFVPNITLVWPEGGTVLKVYANDTLGNENFSTVTFTVDTILPIVTIFEPENITYNSTTIPLSVVANEPIALFQFSLNLAANVTFTPNTTFITLVDGLNSLDVWAQDNAENFNLSSVFFTANLTAADVPRNLTIWINLFNGPVAWVTSAGKFVMKSLTVETITLSNGAIITDNETCLFLNSPDGTTTSEICDV